ncbi:uncharacterized protein N7482_007179 [Penicillium canariense]|uniref:Carboxylesterase type B domain-containing protein n=1 Tax=Penicillium canariense TaxID=189055 RepID=A0A9W9LJM0_9EURO|nr:uncharacterized protein N7482_007179 [Penicillium canariense]KAJ5160175.1 hypothetical protein N7482_007179 [Penicillium canariense]
MHFFTILLPLAASLVSAVPAARSATKPTVTLDYTTVEAVAGNETLGYYKYQNIRFAAVPTGSLRFAKPQWPSKESGINNGTTYASADVDCSSEEDCLYMDVWAPANSKGKKLPVMVWTYGGGFTGGSKSENTPEGLFDLSKDFVFVSFNYRLGITGIANSVTATHQGATDNVALYDVEHAYKWVKKYISNFGGNPDDVTAFGFSAGASMPLFQITRYGGHNEQLFNKAYITSPGFVPGAGHHQGEMFWQNVSTAVGCSGGDLSCMRNVAFANLTDAATDVYDAYGYQFQPRVDGDFVADTYESQLYQGRFNWSGPLVITHEQHENNGSPTSGVNTTADVESELRVFFPGITDDVVEEIMDLYPESDYTSPGYRFADMRQSFDLTAHNYALTRALNNNTWNAMVALESATHGTDQSYYCKNPILLSMQDQKLTDIFHAGYSTYSLSSSSSSSSSSSGAGVAISSTSSVSSTVAVRFIPAPPRRGTSGAQANIVSLTQRKMQKYLLSFVLTGNPNTKWASDKLYWPKYGSNATELVFNSTMYTMKDDLANAGTIYWNKALWY